MKKHLILIMAFFLLCCSVLQADETIRILTFNIRCSPGEIGKVNAWQNRRDLVVDIIRAGDYDFVGIQEAMLLPQPELNQVGDLKRLLPEYTLYTRPRGKSAEEGESTPIMYLKDRWEMDEEEHGVFWLSDNENEPGSNTWQGACPRTVDWGKFHELKDGKRTGRAVYFINTHFDHVNKEACRKSAVRIAEMIKNRKDQSAPVFLTGDLNQEENSPSIRYLLGDEMELKEGDKRQPPIALTDSYRCVHPDEKYVQTFHGFRGNKTEDFKTAAPKKASEVDRKSFKIDFILNTPDVKPVESEIIRSEATPEGVYPSDHYPVKATFAFPSKM